MTGRLRRLPQGVEYRRAFDGDGGLLVARELRNGWFIETCTCIDVDRVDNFVRSFRRISGKYM